MTCSASFAAASATKVLTDMSARPRPRQSVHTPAAKSVPLYPVPICDCRESPQQTASAANRSRQSPGPAGSRPLGPHGWSCSVP
jgi:hypothetical protein